MVTPRHGPALAHQLQRPLHQAGQAAADNVIGYPYVKVQAYTLITGITHAAS